MSGTLPAFVLGYHGCRSEVAEAVFSGEPLLPSENDHDWLGGGFYFWEQSESRAWDWAETRHGGEAAVVGAVIDLGQCLNLLDLECLDEVRAAHDAFVASHGDGSVPLPSNSGAERLVRRLDCAVINFLNDAVDAAADAGETTRYQSVRAMFQEGQELYPSAGFSEKNHIQICIRDPRCLVGFFRPSPPPPPLPAATSSGP